MKKKDYKKLIDPKKHQVFILHCPAGIPMNFASHPWFVCNSKGNITRWEVLVDENKDKEWGHIHKNHLPPFDGLKIIKVISQYRWAGKLLKQIEGELAERMIKFIEMSKENYPHKKYSFIGTNSNTYAQWVLSHFDDPSFQLPWNSFGKNAK